MLYVLLILWLMECCLLYEAAIFMILQARLALMETTM